MDDAFCPPKKTQFPYAMFGIYERPLRRKKPFKEKDGARIFNLRLDVAAEEYKKRIGEIKRRIFEGDIYQANFTTKYRFNFSGIAEGLFEKLKKRQKTSYSAFVSFGENAIISLSPELFFCRSGDRLTVKPMKGTVERGTTPAGDRKKRNFLMNDPKNRSENLMIVDLLRNDIGKISIPGTVKVRKLFETEKYKTLYQMTSTIESRLKKGVSPYELVKAVFPSGSVTGAPKIRSMKILAGMEKEPRKIYTGAVGYFKPGGDAVFNVAIRTLLLKGARGEMGTGGGIIHDSVAKNEFRECRLKARFLSAASRGKFELVETMAYEAGFTDPGLHMARMKKSAEYFGFIFNKKTISDKLAGAVSGLKPGRYRVRVLLGADGFVRTEVSRSPVIRGKLRIAFSGKRVNCIDPFLFHKTTKRELYNRELARARKSGFFDVIFTNDEGFVTEGAVTNVYAEINGRLFTPPVSCGLLPGTVRRVLISKGLAGEKKLTRDDLKKADAVFVSNSITGLRQVAIYTAIL